MKIKNKPGAGIMGMRRENHLEGGGGGAAFTTDEGAACPGGAVGAGAVESDATAGVAVTESAESAACANGTCSAVTRLARGLRTDCKLRILGLTIRG